MDRLDAISGSLSILTSSLAEVTDRLTSLEERVDNVKDLITTAVNEEVEAKTAGIRDDISTLTIKTDSLLEQVESDVISIDWRLDLSQARCALPGKGIQGNLDPLALYAGPEVTKARARDVLAAGRGDGHIFNLGHGILPKTPIESVEALVQTVHDWKG